MGRINRVWWCVGLALLLGGVVQAEPPVERVSTAVPFPRGLVVVDGELYVLARGRVRDSGGVTAAVNDRAGTLYRMDPGISEPVGAAEVSAAVRDNGVVVAKPTDPPFYLWNRAADPPDSDRRADRPYCALRYHAASDNFFLCAFSGIDMAPGQSDGATFSKNTSDGLLRFDRRTNTWHEVERHNLRAGGNYPHHDPAHRPPPHGWLNGPDNCLVVGDWLYAVAKDNSVMVRYDLRPVIADPAAPAPPSHYVIGSDIYVQGMGRQEYFGHSALAFHDGWLYIGYRTSSVILRIRLDAQGLPVQPIQAQLLATFDPYDPATGRSANITDIDIDERGRVYVVSASPARVFRFTPDPRRVYDGRTGRRAAPWADLAAITGNPKMKSENVLCHDGWAYVTSGDGYDYQQGAAGTVYRVRIGD